MRMYISVYVYVYVCVYTHTYDFVSIFLHIHIHKCVYVSKGVRDRCIGQEYVSQLGRSEIVPNGTLEGTHIC